MSKDVDVAMLGAIEEVFGDRLKRSQPQRPAADGALASVFPTSADEVALLARLAERYAVPLAALGAETAPEKPAKEGKILVRFDLMRGLWLSDEPWAEAEPGALWLELDNDLRVRGHGLTVYPTSAPRATVGGWLAQDGVGVGSFGYGRLRENVLSADLVMPGGGRQTVGGDELQSVFGPGKEGVLVVRARLRTRRADNDVPYTLAFRDHGGLAEAATGMFREGAPLWHVGFLNPEMARSRGLGKDYLLFGAYPGGRSEAVENMLREVASSGGGSVLPPAEAYRAWGERFFPLGPLRPSPPLAERRFVPIVEVETALQGYRAKAVQGTVARSGEVLVLAFDPHPENGG